jgi:bisphosphoglycerate-independent phosphoglycerate mutase (AlkP superfamily)
VKTVVLVVGDVDDLATIAAGRPVRGAARTISDALRDESFWKNEALNLACQRAEERNRALHLIGLATDSDDARLEHAFALLDLAKRRGVPRTIVHAIGDGLEAISSRARACGAELASAPASGPKAIHDAVVHGGSFRRGDQAILWNLRGRISRPLARALCEPEFRDFDRGAAPTVELTTLADLHVPAAAVAFRGETSAGDLFALLARAGVPVAFADASSADAVARQVGSTKGLVVADEPAAGGIVEAALAAKAAVVRADGAGKVTLAGVERSGALADVAPTVLGLLGVPVPDVMTGRTLVAAS